MEVINLNKHKEPISIENIKLDDKLQKEILYLIEGDSKL